MQTADIKTTLCQVCGSYYTQKYLLDKHNLDFHSPQQKMITTLYQCSICKICCTQQIDLENHFATAHGHEKYQCGDCSLLFDTRQELTQHYSAVHEEKEFYSCTKGCPDVW